MSQVKYLNNCLAGVHRNDKNKNMHTNGCESVKILIYNFVTKAYVKSVCIRLRGFSKHLSEKQQLETWYVFSPIILIMLGRTI